ncbi:hypothetical protein QUF54_07630, partial [Candidatus Marithioploca araucensis]|nr:hypothetical protein [Candidatus Marithioploca araucensis]
LCRVGKVLFLPTFLIKKCRCTKKTLPTYMAFLMRKVGNKKTLPTLHGLWIGQFLPLSGFLLWIVGLGLG